MSVLPTIRSNTGPNSSVIANVVMLPTSGFDRNTAALLPKPIIASRNAFSASEHGRDLKLVAQPFTLSRTPSIMAARPREFCEQTDEVLAEFGFSTDDIAKLRERKVV